MEHTVRGYEEAGASAIQLEDQEFPKKCGHTPNRKALSCFLEGPVWHLELQ